MPPTPVIADVFRVTLNWKRGTERPAANVLHFKAPTANETDVFNTIDANVVRGMWALVSSAVGVESIDILPLDGTSASSRHSTGLPLKWTGEEPGGVIPNGCALVSLRTGLRGRSNRGRIYLPFVGESGQDDGALSAT